MKCLSMLEAQVARSLYGYKHKIIYSEGFYLLIER